MSSADEDQTLTGSDCRVFVLGAGSSVASGPPVMRSFLPAVRDAYFRSGRSGGHDDLTCHRTLLDFHARCRGSGSDLLRDWDNLEELYTQADLQRLAELPNAEDLCNEIAWSIWDIYRQHNGAQLRLFQAVQQTLDQSLHPVFITTNYDLVIEHAIGFTYPQHPTCFYPGFPTTRQYTSPELLPADVMSDKVDLRGNGIPLIKLHGSANWFQHGDEDYSLYTGFRQDRFGDTQQRGLEHESFGRKHATDEIKKILGEQLSDPSSIRPAIIPPMLGKTTVHSVVAMNWRYAIEAFRRAREIWFIGYSFPDTDTFMPRLLAEGLAENHDLDRLYVIDMQSQADWQSRLNRLFSPVFQDTKLRFFSLLAIDALNTIVTSGAGQHMETQLERRQFERLKNIRD